MKGKPAAGLIAAVVIAPICVVCVLGPMFLGSIVAGALGWITGLGFTDIAGVAIVAGIVVHGLVRWRRANAATIRDTAIHTSQTMDRGTG